MCDCSFLTKTCVIYILCRSYIAQLAQVQDSFLTRCKWNSDKVFWSYYEILVAHFPNIYAEFWEITDQGMKFMITSSEWVDEWVSCYLNYSSAVLLHEPNSAIYVKPSLGTDYNSRLFPTISHYLPLFTKTAIIQEKTSNIYAWIPVIFNSAV